MRSADVRRQTGETDIHIALDLDGRGEGDIATGVGFFDHMLTLLAKHSLINLNIKATGDLETGSHHTVEDTGILLGTAVDKALGDRRGIERYGEATIPMDECLAQAVIDISGRPLAVIDAPVPSGAIGGFENDLMEEFMRAFAGSARITLHLRLIEGGNPHHVIEVCFKAFARALRMAVSHNSRERGVPSTKGTL